MGAAGGKVDAWVFMAGIVGGILGFAEIYPMIYDFAWSGDLGSLTLPDWLGISPRLVAVGVVVIAVGLFSLAAIVEKKFGRTA